MQAILSDFRGETTLAEIPDQVFDTTAPTPTDVPDVDPSATITAAPRRNGASDRHDTAAGDRRREHLRRRPRQERHLLTLATGVRPHLQEPCRTIVQVSRTRARAAAASDGPDTVVNRAPTCSASSCASAASDSGATITNSPAAAAPRPPRRRGAVVRQSDSNTVILRPARERVQLIGGCDQVPRPRRWCRSHEARGPNRSPARSTWEHPATWRQ